MTLQGIDISSYQTKTPSLVGLSFVICRASIGGDADTLYPKHAAAVRKAGLELGAYHFGENESIPVQVSAFIASYQRQQPDFFALDLEGAGPRAMTDAEAAEFLRQFAVRTGRTIGLYGSTSGYPDIGQDWRWVADTRGPKPPIPYDIWQYNDSGPDHDRFEGTLEDFRAVTRGHGSGPNQPTGGDVIVPLNAGTLVTKVAGTRIYADPDVTTAPLASTLPAGMTLTVIGQIEGWRRCVVNLGGVPQEAWIRADEVTGQKADAALQAAIVAGAVPPCSITQADVDNARAAGAEVQWLADSAAVKGAAPA